MVLAAFEGEGSRSPHPEGPRPPLVLKREREVVWHDIECGSYRADLGLWRELAELAQPDERSAPILEIGAGTGRVALDLARGGHRVTALDIDHELLRALRERAADMQLETVCADARRFGLSRRDFAACLAPMQTVQLLGGPDGRLAFLRRVRAHLRPGGLLACAIVTDIEPFDCASGDLGPSPEIGRVDGTIYVSRATRVRIGSQSIHIERERSTLTDERSIAPAQPVRERNVVELDVLSSSRLQREALDAGLTVEGTRAVASTEEHVGSVVVILGA